MWTANPDRIRLALGRIDPAFLGTPVLRSDTIDRLLGATLLFKDETANPIRSFKGRGACNLLEELEGPGEVVCASAGNFGQGLAWAAARRGVPVTVFAARTAIQSKVDAMRALGAAVVLDGDDFDAAKDAAKTYAAAQRLLYIEDGAHAAIAEGAGTIALEVTEELNRLDGVLCPLGNGALAAGVGAWLKHRQPDAEMVVVGAIGAPAMARSVEAGAVTPTETVDTIADGIAVRAPIESAVQAVRRVVDGVALVGDNHIRLAMKTLREQLGRTVEPAGAVGLAAVIADPGRWRGKRIVVPLCGGNV